jgi:hypothetical protein
MPAKATSGKIVIGAIVAVALLLTAIAWWHRFQQGRRALAFWGAENAQLIRHAPEVELLELSEDSNDSAERSRVLSIDGRAFSISRRADLSGAAGLVHARHSLIVDQNFQWDERPPGGAIDWDLAWRFAEGDRQVVVLLDFDERVVKRLGQDRAAVLHEKIVAGMHDYARRRLAD